MLRYEWVLPTVEQVIVLIGQAMFFRILLLFLLCFVWLTLKVFLLLLMILRISEWCLLSMMPLLHVLVQVPKLR